MKRRELFQLSALFVTGLATHTALGQRTSAPPIQMIGNMTTAQFQAANKRAAAAVAAVRPTNAPLTENDIELMTLLALGSRMQLEASTFAAGKVTDPDVLILANAETAEQIGMLAKLKEIAASKDLEVASAVTRKAQRMLTRLRTLSGEELEEMYLAESGVRGHQQLRITAERVIAEAQDPALRDMASAAHPLIISHLQAAEAEVRNS